MSHLGKLIESLWLTMLADDKVPEDARRQALRHSILVDIGNDRYFEAHGPIVRVGHRRWMVGNKAVA